MGYVYVDWQRAQTDSPANLNPTDLERLTGISKTTILKMKKGQQVQSKKATSILRAFKISDPYEYLSDTPAHVPQRSNDPRKQFHHWQLLDQPVTAPSDCRLPCRVATARHELDHRLGRARCYDLESLSDDDIDYLRTVLLKRHPEICLQLEGNLQFPHYYDSGFVGRDIYWVIDKYEAGETILQAVKRETLSTEEVPQIAREIAEGLLALHEMGVVRRELSPELLLLRANERSTLFLDLEMAKVKGAISSRPVTWSRNPFFAPEVDSPDVDYRADFFSWAQIVLFCLTGQKPTSISGSGKLISLKLPRRVMRLLETCLQPQRSMRRFEDFRQVLDVLNGW